MMTLVSGFRDRERVLELAQRVAAASSILLALVIPLSSSAQTPVRNGVQFLVNTYTTDDQFAPAVAVDAEGNFVVVWQSNGSDNGDTYSHSVQGQRYASDGSRLGGQFLVNTYTPRPQRYPSVAVDPEGDFVVVWSSYGSGDTSSGSIPGQRFASNGSALGGEFLVNTYTMYNQRFPSVAVGPAGDFVVVWHSRRSAHGNTAHGRIQGQRFGSNGSALGDEFQVNTYTTSWVSPAVAVNSAGDFVVVWTSTGSAGSDTGYSIQGQRYAADGIPVGSEFQVNSYTTGNQLDSAVAVAPDGDFVVVWESDGSYGSDFSRAIQGQRFDAAGTPLGSEFQVNSYTTYSQSDPAVAVDAVGNFVVVWVSYGSAGSDSSKHSVQGQRFDAGGTPVGSEFQVNSYTTGYQRRPSVAVDAEGDFVVVWDSDGSDNGDTSYESVQGQRFLARSCDEGGLLCLNENRFEVEIEWLAFDGNAGPGRVVPFGSDDSGLFWFFAPDNWEILVKVLDGCAINDHFWVFAAGTAALREHRARRGNLLDCSSCSWRQYHGRPLPSVPTSWLLVSTMSRRVLWWSPTSMGTGEGI